MAPFSAQLFVVTLALVGGVLLMAALLSGLIERSRLPQVAAFLGLGAVLGSAGLGLIDVSLESPILRVVATLSLVLVLFTDALNLDFADVRKHAGLAAIVLGPGTILSAVIVALGAWWLLELPLPAAAILGAALASTDPVLLRAVFRNPSLPAEVRQALRMESGLNDAVLLPVILVAMNALAPAAAHGAAEGSGPSPGTMVIQMLLLGPGAGVGVGLAGIAALDLVRRRVGVRRDYESLYSLGIAFLAYAAAEAVHGSGFLAAFAAGLTIVALDVELCDCFLEYGETTAEMTLLFTFVLLGGSLIWSGFALVDLPTVAFVVLVILARPLAFLPSLWLTRLPRRSRWTIAWLGPRGLSSLLLVLLPVFAGIPGSERLFQICCLVVLVSVVLHGGSLAILLRDERAEPPAGSPPGEPDAERVTIEEMKGLQSSGAPVVVLDARTERSARESGLDAEGAVRVPPDEAVARARALDLPRDAWLMVFCA